MSDEEETGHRESPMVRNGGMASGDSGDDRYHSVYDGGVGFPPGGDGRSYPAGHPPIDCPNPRIMAGLRGLYRCPACGEKIRLAGHRSGSQLGYAAADAIGGAIVQAWAVAWPSLCTIARGAAWLASWAWHRAITRHHDPQEDNSAALDNDSEPDRPGPQSARQGAPESSEKAETQLQAQEEIPVLTCTKTSDGEHVPAWRDDSWTCIACTEEIDVTRVS